LNACLFRDWGSLAPLFCAVQAQKSRLSPTADKNPMQKQAPENRCLNLSLTGDGLVPLTLRLFPFDAGPGLHLIDLT
jgi:hypothetical protein